MSKYFIRDLLKSESSTSLTNSCRAMEQIAALAGPNLRALITRQYPESVNDVKIDFSPMNPYSYRALLDAADPASVTLGAGDVVESTMIHYMTKDLQYEEFQFMTMVIDESPYLYLPRPSHTQVRNGRSLKEKHHGNGIIIPSNVSSMLFIRLQRPLDEPLRPSYIQITHAEIKGKAHG